MKWFLLSVIALLMLVAVIVAIGAALPREHVARSRATLRTPVDSVWHTLKDVAAYPAWRTDLARVEMLAAPDGHPVWREHDKHDAITFEETEAIAPTRLQTRIADETLPFGGTWTYELSPVEDGTVVTITENGVVRNPLFRFMSRFVFGHHATQEKYLRALGKRFDQDISPERIR